MNFPNRLIDLMNEKKVSAYQVYKDTGISDSLIGYWRKDEKQPTKNNIEKLSSYFNVSIDYLLGREEQPQKQLDKLTIEEQNIFYKLRQLNKMGINRLDAYIDGLLVSDDYRNDAARETTAQNKSATA